MNRDLLFAGLAAAALHIGAFAVLPSPAESRRVGADADRPMEVVLVAMAAPVAEPPEVDGEPVEDELVEPAAEPLAIPEPEFATEVPDVPAPSDPQPTEPEPEPAEPAAADDEIVPDSPESDEHTRSAQPPVHIEDDPPAIAEPIATPPVPPPAPSERPPAVTPPSESPATTVEASEPPATEPRASETPPPPTAEPAPAASPKPAPAESNPPPSNELTVRDPIATRNPSPTYPRTARSRGYEGTVVLRALVLTSGRCGDVEIKTSSGHDVLDRAAVKALRRWRFEPATRAGEPVDRWIDLPFEFHLHD